MPSLANLSPELLWQRALRAEVGIAISTSDRVLSRQQLYRYKYETKDIRFDAYAIIFPENGELWIVRRDVDVVS